MVAQAVYAQCHNIDEVWISPCYAHQFGKKMASIEQRAAMVSHATFSIPQGVRAWFGEWENKFEGTTWEFSQLIEKLLPQHNFHFVIGYDNAVSILDKWKHGPELIQNRPFIVVNRALKEHQEAPKDAWWLKAPHQYIDLHWATASTEVREAIVRKDYRFAQRYVHPKVWDVITDNGLYGYE